MYKVTLDFENETVEWDTDSQKGTESCPGLSERKEDILAAMRYKVFDLTSIMNTVNDLINGRISEDDFNEALDREAPSEEEKACLMKTIDEVIDNYQDYETSLDNRFGRRFADFLNAEQLERIGYSLKEGVAHEPIEWTRENILAQLKNDVEYGWEKACDERGISSGLMHEVVCAWNKVLGEGLEAFNKYEPYGKPTFKATAAKYGWELG